MTRRVFWGLALVVVGALLLGANFGYVQHFSVWGLWPLIFIVGALEFIFGRALVVYRHGGIRSVRFNLGIGIGGKLIALWFLVGATAELLNNVHLIPFDWGDVAYWTLPLLLVGIGLAIILRPSRHRFYWSDWSSGSGRAGARGDWESSDRSTRPIPRGRPVSGTSAVVGDLRFGSRPWDFKSPMDVSIWAGDIDMDLTTAEFGSGDQLLTIRGWAGDINVRIPDGVEVFVEAHCSAGEIRVFDERRDGVSCDLRVHRGADGLIDDKEGHAGPSGSDAVAGDAVRLFIGIDVTFGNVRVR